MNHPGCEKASTKFPTIRQINSILRVIDRIEDRDISKIPKREINKIRSILGKKGLRIFVAADKYWHKKAKELAQVADRKNMKQVVNLTTELVQRCANCHLKYREPLRDSARWRQR